MNTTWCYITIKSDDIHSWLMMTSHSNHEIDSNWRRPDEMLADQGSYVEFNNPPPASHLLYTCKVSCLSSRVASVFIRTNDIGVTLACYYCGGWLVHTHAVLCHPFFDYVKKHVVWLWLLLLIPSRVSLLQDFETSGKM